MIEYLGTSGNLALFSSGAKAVIIDLNLNLVSDISDYDSLSLSKSWTRDSALPLPDTALELAIASFQTLEGGLTASASGSDRMYTIPGGVQNEAKKALEWRKEHGRGGTPVGLNTARTLAKGGQIGIKKVRHIAKYFPRHEVDKKAKGWSPGEDNFPSNGRIAWALWGGDAGQRWASAIVERDNKKATTAGGYTLPGYEESIDEYGVEYSYDSDISAFKLAHEMDSEYGPEFMARVRMDNSGIDRLYKIEIDGNVYLWDGSGWDNLGHVDGDVYLYDNELDDPDDTCEKTHVMVDPSSAVIISAFMQERPYQPVRLEEIDPEESALMAEGLASEDFTMIDRVMTAAGEPATSGKSSKADKDGDGKLDSDFLSEKAESQPRDASGLFVEVGSRVVVAGDKKRGSGTLESIDYKNNKVNVELDSGKTISVSPKFTQGEDTAGPSRPISRPPVAKAIDFSGILGEPRTPINFPRAQLPGTMKAMTRGDLHDLINNFPQYVQDARNSYKLMEDSPKGMRDYNKKYMKKRYDMDLASDGIVAAGNKEENFKSPRESDVTPKYLALVSPDDKAAVMDLVAIAPENASSTAPVVFERRDGKWARNDQILADLKSASPPPVIELDDKKVLNEVLVQVDEADGGTQASAYNFDVFWINTVEPLLAAGGLDRNRGGAEKLRRYWTRGKGALKIRWGTPGDWTRCVRQLSKYMGPRAKGYCQLRHKEATGVYTGSRYNVGKKNKKNFGTLFETSEQFDRAILQNSTLTALAQDARDKVSLTASAGMSSGSSFYISMLVPEEIESGDGRKFKKGSISVRDLPVPLLWQIKTGSGHDGSVVVGRIDYIERVEGGLGNAYGIFDAGPYGREAERLVRHGFLRGVSVDLDQFEAKENKKPKLENSEDGDEIGKDKLTINKARIMAATIVAKPAFQECSIELQNQGDQEDNLTPEDGVYEESMEDFADLEPIMASGFLKSPVPLIPPADWFKNPGFTKPTPLTVDDNGRVYGHIAAWQVSHIGLPRATKPPRSRSKYAYFNTGVIRTEEGTDVPVGQLTLAGGHAPLNADAASAAKHYDDTASSVADIHVGEDEYGIWCAGSLRPNLDEMQIRALRASAPSGDWRPINGSLELVAICQVNVPGFPTARAMVASGKVLALVAAGASYMAMIRCSGAACALEQKAELLGELSTSTPNLRLKVEEARKSLINFQLSALQEEALVASAVAELAKISNEERIKLAKKGHALPDGAYPIRDEEDLKNAIQAYGRSKASERRMVRKHIMKRARQLGKWMLVPEQWKNASSIEATERVASMREAITAAAIKNDEISEEDLKKLRDAKEEADKQTEEEIEAAREVEANRGDLPTRDEEGRVKYVSGVNQPRDAKGKYRKVLARLKQDLGVAGLSRALRKVEEAENLDFAGDYAASAGASADLLDMLDRLDDKALNPEALENVRNSAAELGRVIANLPLPFGKDASKLRFSDLPSGLKDLIEQMITRVEAKIGKEDADIATQKLRSYMAGADLFNQGEVQSEMSKLLRLLT
jgi:hypothetical protein